MPRPPDIIYGRNPILEAFRAGRPGKRLLFAEGLREEPRLRERRERAAARRSTIESAERGKLHDIAHPGAHQGGVAHVGPRAYRGEDPMAAQGRPPAPCSRQRRRRRGVARAAEEEVRRPGPPPHARQGELTERRRRWIDFALRGRASASPMTLPRR